MTDPVAEKSTFLCMYMSNHPDTLVAYVRYWGKVSEAVVSAKMTAIDSKGMNLKYKTKNKSNEDKEVRVTFDPPLSSYEEVKPRLLSMTADAQEALGMSKAPQITSFELSPQVHLTGIPLLLLAYSTVSPFYEGTYWEPGKWLFNFFGGSTTFKIIWTSTIIAHFLEALYVQRLCVKHRTGFATGFKYVFSTFLFGFTVLVPFRKRIQKARIDSIMKVD